MTTAGSPYSPDRPHDLGRPEEDVFGHGDYADALVDALTRAPTPFTVGVFGEWGVGKSTIIAAVKQRLPRAVAFAYFDAWRYEGDALRRQLLRDVARQLTDAKQLDRSFDMNRDLRDLDVEVSTPDEAGLSFSVRELIRAGLQLIVTLAFVYALLRIRTTAGLFTGKHASSDALSALVVSLVLAFVGLVVQPFKVVQRTLTTRRIEEPDQFSAKFEKLMGAVRAKRLVVAIDNLDRCSPEHAVEVLSTIKTYLEPSLEPPDRRLLGRFADEPSVKEAVFLIAADSDALRRHLVAQETHRSEGTDPDLVRRYVDEYLRKFFSATIPVRAMLDEDVRKFVEEHLRRVADAHGQSEALSRLAEMCGTGLRGNPRRVNQFANDLELRLALLAAREAEDSRGQRKIQPPISDNLLMVAKLLLVEEEWPARFAQLQANPRLLEEWERVARQAHGAPPPAAGTDDVEQPKPDPEWPRFAAFLRITADVTTPNIRAFLLLKQSQEEVQLPGFLAFRELVVAGDRDEVRARIDSQEFAPPEAFAARLPYLLRSETAEGFLDGARAVIDAAVTIPEFASLAVAGQVVANALDVPALRPELARLDPFAVFAVVAAHCAAEVNAVTQALFAEELAEQMAGLGPAEATERIAELAAALSVSGPLLAGARDVVVQGLAASPGNYKVVAPLLQAAPGLISVDIAEHAVRDVMQSDGLPTGELSPDAPALAIAELDLENDRVSPEVQSELLGHLAKLHTPAVVADGPRLTAMLAAQDRLVRRMSSAPADAFVRLFDHLQSMQTAIEVDVRARLLAFQHTLVSIIEDEGVVEELSARAASQFFAPDAPGALRYVVEHRDDLPFRPFIERELLTLARQPPLAGEAAQTIARYTENVSDGLREVVENLVSQQQWQVATQVVQTLRHELSPVGTELLATTLAAAQPTPAPPQFLVLVGALGEFVDASQVGTIHTLFTRQLDTGQPDATNAALSAFESLEAQPAFAEGVAPFLDHSLGRLEAMPHYAAPVPQMIWDFAARHVDRMLAEQRSRSNVRATEWLRVAPQTLAQLDASVRQLGEQSTNDERATLVQALLGVERLPIDMVLRQAYLQTASAIGHDRRSRAWQAVNDRLTELAGSHDPQEQSMAAAVRASIDAA